MKFFGKTKRTIAAFCISLMMVVSTPKLPPAQAEPISVVIAIKTILALLTGWYSLKEVKLNVDAMTFARSKNAVLISLKQPSFPVDVCVDPALIVRSGNARAIKGKAYFVMADDNRALVPIMQTYFCKSGILGKHGGKAIIGIFKDPITARRFAEIVFTEGEGFVKTSYSTKPFDANLKLD